MVIMYEYKRLQPPDVVQRMDTSFEEHRLYRYSGLRDPIRF